jgi:hypothetical protein
LLRKLIFEPGNGRSDFSGILMPRIRCSHATLMLAACVLSAEVCILSAGSALGHGIGAPSVTPRVHVPTPPRINVPSTRVDVPRPNVTPRSGANTSGNTNASQGGTNTSNANTSQSGTSAATDNVAGPIIQNVIAAAIVPQSAYVPGPAVWTVPAGGGSPTFSGAGATTVATMVIANTLINNLNHYLPPGHTLSQDQQNYLTAGANGLIAGGLTLATGTAGVAALPAAMIAGVAAGSATLGTGASILIETTFTNDAVGDPTLGTGIRAGLNGVTAGGIAAGAAVAGAWIVSAPLTVPASTIALAVGGATAVVYVARPAIDAAVDGTFDAALGAFDAVFGPPDPAPASSVRGGGSPQ